MTHKSTSLLGIFALGALVRYWLMTSNYKNVIANRIEVSTPINSWKRITEGLYLLKSDIHPYSGDLLHEPPLHLALYKLLVELTGQYLHLLFIFLDVCTAYLLYTVATKHTQRLVSKNPDISKENIAISPSYVVAAYLFNPYCIFNCIGCTTTVFSNFFLALSLVGMMNNCLLLSTLPLAMCICQNLYPVLLVSPLFLQLWNEKKHLKAFLSVVLVFSFWALLVHGSYYISNSWEFINDTYGFILTVPDLRPNTGLFWYFFIEMFEHFRSLFIYSFQINVTLLYLIPLSVRFRKEPLLLTTSLLALIAIFKSYPCLGDVGFILALLPCWKHLFKYVQQGFLVGCCFFVTTVFAPTVWYLWIYSGSANANFYFGVTLAFATAQIFLITDVLFAHIKYEFASVYGHTRKIDGKDAVLVLE